MMDLMQIYTAWLTLFSMSFTFMPIVLLLDWQKRGTADGFSSVTFVLPLLMMSCWFKHGWLTGDHTNMFINGFNLVFFAVYITAFWFYQPKRKYLYGQLAGVLLTIAVIFQYVNMKPEAEQAASMGSIASATQIASMAGGVYDLKRAAQLKTMEFIPATMQFAFFALSLQWTIFALLIGNAYMAIANVAGLMLNVTTLSFYIIYPPRTWKVPIFGVGGKEEAKGKKAE